MDQTETRALFDATMRRDPPPEEGTRDEWEGLLLRRVGPHPCIDYSDLTAETVAAAIQRQIEFVRRTGLELEWKVYEHDRPADLATRLAAAGFVPDPAEVLVAYDLATPLVAPALDRVEVRRVTSPQELDDAVEVGARAFGEPPEEIRERLAGRLEDPTMALLVAYADGAPVASGRLELPPKRPFASLWGGGTVPEARRRGVYRALVAARANLAADLGYRFVTVDARDSTSRPILERMGFVRLAGVVGWILTPTAASGNRSTGPATAN